jgi:hypothetical protein
MCWFDPPESSKKIIKYHCVQIIDEIHRLQKEGDPYGWELQDVHKLLDHLNNPKSCDEKPKD